ncbi:MAG TPA: CoA transferase [Candidatus Acidoferrales bacterium]|nr:CoA transferase [Candidatus Acidoferrales bacterium]
MKPLEGVRVLELGAFITAPLCGMMLANLGADVIKVENPKTGDSFRAFRGKHYSPRFAAYNRGKRSIAVDLATDAGHATVMALAKRSDVLIENFRPDVMPRLGLAWDAVHEANPKLIYCSITGFGADGPFAARPAFDAVGLAMSGIAALFLDPSNPELMGPTITDNVTGMFACYGILGALYERERSGVGRRVEVNMLESSIAFMPDAFANALMGGGVMERLTRVAASQSYAFSCSDGKLLAIQLSTQEKFWTDLLGAIERPELALDSRFSSRDARVANYVELRALLRDVFVTRSRSEWFARLERCDVPFAPVHALTDVVADEQVAHLGTFYSVRHPDEGDLTLIHNPVRIDSGRVDAELPPPTLGEHTAEILHELTDEGYCATPKI